MTTQDDDEKGCNPVVEPGRKTGGDYEVGYGKPPVEMRFKKGQSGNPAGRRKGPEPKSAKAVLEDVLGEATTVVINGRRRVVTVREALYRDLAYRALAGDARARRDLLMVSDKLGELNELAGEQHMTISWMPAEEPRFANRAAGGGENLDADSPPLHGSDPNDEWG